MIRVGGATEVEGKEKKDRVDDAVNAIRAAGRQGISLVGGPLLHATIKSSTAPTAPKLLNRAWR